MTTYTNHPYVLFNFLVDLETGKDAGALGGFQEMSGLTKITGINKSRDVTFKRGLIAAAALHDWLDEIRHGHKGATRTLTIRQQDEENKTVVTWKLVRARVIKHSGGPLNAKVPDVAMEELVIAYERLELEERE